MKKIVILILAVSLSGITLAQRPGGKMQRNQNFPQRFQQRGPGQGQCLMPNLTEEQRDQMKELRLGFLEDLKPLRNQMGELKAEYRSMTTADDVDMKDVNENIDEQADLMASIKKLHASHQQAVRQVLTDEQKLFFDMRKGNRGKGVRNFRGSGPGRGLGPCGQGFGPVSLNE